MNADRRGSTRIRTTSLIRVDPRRSAFIRGLPMIGRGGKKLLPPVARMGDTAAITPRRVRASPLQGPVGRVTGGYAMDTLTAREIGRPNWSFFFDGFSRLHVG